VKRRDLNPAGTAAGSTIAVAQGADHRTVPDGDATEIVERAILVDEDTLAELPPTAPTSSSTPTQVRDSSSSPSSAWPTREAPTRIRSPSLPKRCGRRPTETPDLESTGAITTESRTPLRPHGVFDQTATSARPPDTNPLCVRDADLRPGADLPGVRGYRACASGRRWAERLLDAALASKRAHPESGTLSGGAASRCGLAASMSAPASQRWIRRAIRQPAGDPAARGWRHVQPARRSATESDSRSHRRPPRLSSSQRAQRHSAPPRREASPHVGRRRSPYPRDSTAGRRQRRSHGGLLLSPAEGQRCSDDRSRR
jgi:hypothetical protein